MSTILASIFSNKAGSFVNELTGAPCWTNARIKRVDIVTDSANSDVPLSTQNINASQVVIQLAASDVQTSKILMPVRVRAELLVDDISVIENVMALFADPTVTIAITSRSVIANAMAISHVEIEQDEEMLSASRVTVFFEQVLEETSAAGTYTPQQPGDQNSYGLVTTAPATVGSSLGAIVNAGSLLGSTAASAAAALAQRVQQNLGI